MYYTQLFHADYWAGGSEAEALVAALEAGHNCGERRREEE
jgi:hypothetical protein